MRDEAGTKYLSAGKLIELLSTLPPDARVICNTVGNLLVMDGPGENYLAYIEFARDGTVESMR